MENGSGYLRILILNGPNINMLGIREPSIYGTYSYPELIKYLKDFELKLDVELEILQSNVEGELINIIQASYGNYEGIVINPGAYTHYSLAIYDTLKAVGVPTIEVHLSNIHAREEYRRDSVIAPACIGQIAGLGRYGYVLGIMGLINYLENK